MYDTTLRDGSQGAGIAFSVADKLKVAARLDAFGVAYIEGGWPGSNPKDREFFARARSLPWRHARLVAFGSTRRPHVAPEDDANLRTLLEAGTPAVTVFGKSWQLHVTDALGTTLEENLRMIYDSIRYLKAQGVPEVLFDAEHFFDGFKADPEYALATLVAAQEAGADWLVLCDTNGGTLPHELPPVFARVRERVSLPLGIHPHNDSGVAVAVALEAVRLGATQVQGTINGYGERTGNLNLTTLLPNLELKLGYRCLPEGRLAELASVARFVAEVANVPLEPSQPYVGQNAFAHKGGIHVSAVLKRPDTYEHVPPESVGMQRQVLVSDLSGRSNLLYKAKERGIPVNPATATALLQEIKRLEHEGYQFEAADGSFELLARRMVEGLPPLFRFESFHVRVEGRPGEAAKAEATVKLIVGDEVLHTVADGNGPVAALDRALRRALTRKFPALRQMTLVDYKVRVLDGSRGTGSRVRVLIETRDEEGTFSTVGVSDNIIEASWLALVDSIEYGIYRYQRRMGLAAVQQPMDNSG